MREYNFFFNDNDELLCEIIDNGEKTELVETDAINELININEMYFNRVRASNRSIRLNGDDISVNIYDLNEFYKESLENLLANARSRNEQLEAEQAREIQESIAASSAAEENKETVEDMMDTWETRASETDADILESEIQELID